MRPVSELRELGQQIDREEYLVGIAAGEVEFSTSCPDWCEDSGRLAHRLPDDDAGTREHSRAFGPFLCGLVYERQAVPGRLFGARVELNAPDGESVTLPELLELADDVERARVWLESQR